MKKEYELNISIPLSSVPMDDVFGAEPDIEKLLRKEKIGSGAGMGWRDLHFGPWKTKKGVDNAVKKAKAYLRKKKWTGCKISISST